MATLFTRTLLLRRFVASAITVSCVLVVGAPAAAGGWDSIPELDGEHLAIPRAIDGPRYDSLRECLEQMESLVGADYYATIVSVTDPEGQRGRDHDDATAYAQHVFEEWTEEEKLDPQRDVVMSVGAVNRSYGVVVGEEWKRQGMTDRALEDVIDWSRFSTQFGRVRFDNALCELAEALDHRLASLQVEHDYKVEAAEEKLPEISERYSEVESRLEDRLPKESERRDELADELGQVEPLLDVDDEIDDDPTGVIDGLEEVDRVSEQVDFQLGQYLHGVEPLDVLDDEIESMVATVDARDDRDWAGPTAAMETLQRCRARAEEARLVSQPDLLEIRECIGEARARLERSDVRHFFLARAIPGGGLAAFVLLLLGWVGARFRRRRRALGVLTHDLSGWDTGLEQAASKLQRLQEDYEWYFDGREQFWQGEYAEVDRAISDGINRAFLLHDRGRDLVGEARSLYERSKLLNVGKLEEALRILRETSVSLEEGDIEADRPLELPLTGRYEQGASRLLNDLDAGYLTAVEGLEEIAPVQRRIAELVEQAETALHRAEQQIARREQRQLPTDALGEGLQQARALWGEALDEARTIPEQAVAGLEEALEQLEAVCTRATDGNETLDIIDEEIEGLRERLGELLHRAEAQDMEFGDRGFEPVGLAESSGDHVSNLVDLVTRGREREAAQLVGPLVKQLEQAAVRLSVCLECEEVVGPVLGELEEVAPQIKEALFQVRMKVKRLADNSDDPAVAEHAERVRELQKLAPRLGRLVKRIERAHSHGRNLAASADTAALVDQLQVGLESLAIVQRMLDGDTDDTTPLLPGDLMWQPPPGWGETAVCIWGRSEDADEFRTGSLS